MIHLIFFRFWDALTKLPLLRR